MSQIRISKCGCLKILINKKCRGPLVSLRRHLNGARTLASRACDSCLATATTSCQCYQLSATLLHAQHMQPPPHASSPHAVGLKEKPVLSSSRNSRLTPPTPLCLSPPPLLQAPSAGHRTPLSCASEPRQASR
jgi:hypothetical protein